MKLKLLYPSSFFQYSSKCPSILQTLSLLLLLLKNDTNDQNDL